MARIHVHNLDAIVHTNEFIEHLFSCGVYNRYAGYSHAPGTVNHLTVQRHNVERRVRPIAIWGSCMRERVSLVQKFWIRFVEDVVTARAGLVVRSPRATRIDASLLA